MYLFYCSINGIKIVKSKKTYFSATLKSLRCDRLVDEDRGSFDTRTELGVKNDELPCTMSFCVSLGIPLVLARRLIALGFGVTGIVGDLFVVGDSIDAKATLFVLR